MYQQHTKAVLYIVSSMIEGHDFMTVFLALMYKYYKTWWSRRTLPWKMNTPNHYGRKSQPITNLYSKRLIVHQFPTKTFVCNHIRKKLVPRTRTLKVFVSILKKTYLWRTNLTINISFFQIKILYIAIQTLLYSARNFAWNQRVYMLFDESQSYEEAT